MPGHQKALRQTQNHVRLHGVDLIGSLEKGDRLLRFLVAHCKITSQPQSGVGLRILREQTIGDGGYFLIYRDTLHRLGQIIAKVQISELDLGPFLFGIQAGGPQKRAIRCRILVRRAERQTKLAVGVCRFWVLLNRLPIEERRIVVPVGCEKSICFRDVIAVRAASAAPGQKRQDRHGRAKYFQRAPHASTRLGPCAFGNLARQNEGNLNYGIHVHRRSTPGSGLEFPRFQIMNHSLFRGRAGMP